MFLFIIQRQSKIAFISPFILFLAMDIPLQSKNLDLINSDPLQIILCTSYGTLLISLKLLVLVYLSEFFLSQFYSPSQIGLYNQQKQLYNISDLMSFVIFIKGMRLSFVTKLLPTTALTILNGQRSSVNGNYNLSSGNRNIEQFQGVMKYSGKTLRMRCLFINLFQKLL